MNSRPKTNRARVAISGLYAILLAYFTVEILFRRLVWNQIPTQLPTALVYGVLLLNGFLIARTFLRPGPSTKTEKN